MNMFTNGIALALATLRLSIWHHLIYLWVPPEGGPKYRSSNVRVAGGVCGVKWWCLSLAVGLAVSLAVDGNGDGDGILKVLLLKILILKMQISKMLILKMLFLKMLILKVLMCSMRILKMLIC